MAAKGMAIASAAAGVVLRTSRRVGVCALGAMVLTVLIVVSLFTQGCDQSRAVVGSFRSARKCVNPVAMVSQETVITKKRRGPAPTGKGQLIGVRLQPDDLELLDLWIKANDADLNRPEAMRRILRMIAVHTQP